MPFKPGESGNAKGRPPKGRALTEILSREGKRDGRNKVLAALMWTFATTGQVKLGDRIYRAADVSEWIQAVKFIYQHVDGPPKAELDLTSGGGAITPLVISLYGGEAATGGGEDDAT